MILSTGEHRSINHALWRLNDGGFEIPGFADVFAKAGFSDRTVGEGRRLYNTAPTAGELAVAVLAATKKSRIAADIIRDTSLPDGEPVIEALRQEQALKDVRVLDIGCGMVPGFAMAAQAMGAEVHTADGRPLPDALSSMFASHTVVDFNDEAASALLRHATGGGLDMAGATCVIYTPEIPGFDTPGLDTIKAIADSVLVEEGLLFSPLNDLMYKF